MFSLFRSKKRKGSKYNEDDDEKYQGKELEYDKYNKKVDANNLRKMSKKS